MAVTNSLATTPNADAIPQVPGSMSAVGTAANSTLPAPSTAVNPTTAAQQNPYAAPSSTGLPSTSPSTPTNNVAWTTGNDSVVGDFQQTYGHGTGTAITQVLQGLGTSTDAAVTATTNATDQAANQQYANIQAQQAAAGITPNSSAAALAAGDFYSNVNTNLQATTANMELNEEGTLLSSLTGEGAAHGSDQSGWDTFADVMGDIGDVASFGLSGTWDT